MNLVVDCNVIVAAAWKDGISRRVLQRIIADETIIVSDAILAEYRRVSGYSKLATKRTAIIELIDVVEHMAAKVDDRPCPFALPDPEDMAYLAAAHHGDCQAIVIGNLKHFPERTYGTVRILSVREFAALAGVAE